jgi:hypothetical protein
MPADLEFVLLLPALLIGLLLAVEWIVDRWMDRPVKHTVSRFDGRIDPHERALLGDDWRDCVGPYFTYRGDDHVDD